VTPQETLTVRCRGPAAVRVRWYRSLAYALAATSGPGGILFEATHAQPIPWVTIRPRSLVDTFRATAPKWGDLVRPVDQLPWLDPPSGWVERICSVVPVAAPFATDAYRSGISWDVPGIGSRLGPSAWIGFQTHWVRGREGRLWVARRFRLATRSAQEMERRLEPVAVAVAEEWAVRTGGPATTVPVHGGARRDWCRGTVRTVPREAWRAYSIDAVAASAEVRTAAESTWGIAADGHGVVFGSSGAGKTTFLAQTAAREIVSGRAVVVIDLHGDLAPSILARIPEPGRSTVVAVDATDRPVPGVAALPSSSPNDDRAAAHLVAGLKRLSPDGNELYWGFRLERVLDSFVRLAQESGGSLLDLYDLLTDPVRREVARLATRRSDLARFLDELVPILRRQPEFLWSAATRLSKVVLVPSLTELLAPADGGLPVEELIGQRRSILVRLPFASLGPEAATFAGSLVLGRVYLGLASRRRAGGEDSSVLFLLDEAHAFSPRLLAEALSESRKFGVRMLLATQYPDRLAPEVRSAAAGALADFVAFRVPPAAAGTVGGWVGLPREEAERWLPGLPTGTGVRLDAAAGVPRTIAPEEKLPAEDPNVWVERVERTRREFLVAPHEAHHSLADENVTERLLLAVLAAEEEGHPLDPTCAVPSALALPGPALAPELLGDRWRDVLRQQWVVATDTGCRLTDAGRRWLGLTAPTGATRESGEHRALLLATFRLFARRGYAIEIVRQGRFDTTLPDARFRQLASRNGLAPFEVARDLDRVRQGWAWRFFGGRDVHIEVEVSGALRAERVRRGWRKASDRGAFALFVVGDPARARRIRATLRGLSVGPDRAQVWTLPLPGQARSAPLRLHRANA
jgi:hypothetical protein